MKTNAHFLTNIVSVVASMAFTSTALGQEAVLEEITVVAQKREESLQDVPIAITAFSNEELARIGATRLTDLQFNIPNFNFRRGDWGNSAPVVNIRGIGGRTRNMGLEAPFGVYIDGVYMGRAGSTVQEFLDVQVAEVLRGPQGTLFGKNVISGALNVRTRKPDLNDYRGQLSVNMGNYNYVKALGTISGPIVEDKLAFGVDVYSASRDGFVDNVFLLDVTENDLSYHGGRVKLRWTPNDRMEVNISADATIDRRSTHFGEAVDPDNYPEFGWFGPDGIEGTADDRISVTRVQVTPGEFTTSSDYPAIDYRDIYGGSVTIDYELENGYDFTSITAVRTSDGLFAVDQDLLAEDWFIVEFGDETKQFTQEFRIASPADGGRFDFVAGLFYQHLEAETQHDVVFGPDFSQWIQGLVDAGNQVHVDYVNQFGLPNTTETIGDFITQGSQDTDAIAGYFQGNWHFSDNLTATFGARITSESKDVNWEQITTAWFRDALGVPNGFTQGDRTDTRVTPMVSLQYTASENVNFYAKAANGFKSGGFNVDLGSVFFPSANNAEANSFDEENIWNYELGMKAEWFDNRLRTNVTLFHQEYEDLQLQQTKNVNNQFVVAVGNVGKSEQRGVELDINAVPVEGLSIVASIGYLDAEYTEFDSSASVSVVPGQTMPDAPNWNGSASATYVWPISSNLEAMLRGEYTFRGERYIDDANGSLDIPESTLVNAAFGLQSVDGNWGLRVWGKNLTDERYVEFAATNAFLDTPHAFFADPRTYGVEFTMSFD